MTKPRMTLIEMQNVAKKHGIGARRFCELAGIPWQSFYRKRHNEGIVRLAEYDALAKALKRITSKGGDHEDTRKNGVPTPPPGKGGKRRAIRP